MFSSVPYKIELHKDFTKMENSIIILSAISKNLSSFYKKYNSRKITEQNSLGRSAGPFILPSPFSNFHCSPITVVSYKEINVVKLLNMKD